MKKIFLALLLLHISFSLSARSRCVCGTSDDIQVDRIGDEICKFLVDIVVLMPPEVFYAFNEDGDEDDPEYIEAYRWRSSTDKFYYGLSKWECEYIHYHDFGGINLWEPAETLSLLENISNEIQDCRDTSIKGIEVRIRDFKYDYYPYGYFPRDSMKKDKQELLEKLESTQEKYAQLQTKFEGLETFVDNAYEEIFRSCVQKHGNEFAYYNLGFLAFARGDFFSALQHLKQIQNLDTLSTRDQIDARYQLGKTHNLLGLYEEAIQALTQVIQADPEKKEAYFERALAYFEKGQFDEAIEDYLQSDFKSTPIGQHSLEFAAGLLKGASFGAAHTMEHFVPSMLCSLQGLANGLWSFACDPKEVSKEMVQAAKNIYEFLQDASALETLRALIPEVDELIGDWKDHTQFRKGELIGTIVGKYGTDIFLLAGTGKALKLFEEMRVANAALTLDAMKGLEKQSLLLEKSAKWHEANVTKTRAKRKLAEELGAKHANQNLNETQVRKILHSIGFETFPKPKGMDLKNYNVSLSKSGGGMVYTLKSNKHYNVRVMPGNPNSSNPAQRRPYVIHKTPEGALDKKGKVVKSASEEAHIPIEDYDFSRISEVSDG